MSARELVQLETCLTRASTWNPLRASAGDVFRYIDLSSVDQVTKSISNARLVACGEAPSRARQLVAAGDVLVSTVRPNLNGVARVSPELDGATASTGFCVLRPQPNKVDGGYLFQWVKSSAFVSDMVSKATGASYPAVSDRIIFESAVPLPPLEEQRRIAAILDQAETLRTQRRQALAHLDALTQSLFLDMFGEQSEFPLVPLDQVCELITDGTHYTPTYADEGVIFLSAKNVTSGRIDWEQIKHIPESLHQELHKRVAPKLGDVLMAKNGTTGVAAIVDRDCTFDIYVSLALLRPSSKIEPVFLHAALNSPLSKTQFNAALKGIGVPNLHLKDIRGAKIPLPPLAPQHTFASRIQAIEALKATHRAALAQLDALFASLQQRAFSGELTAPTHAAAAKPPAKRSFAQLGQLDAYKGIESLVYAAKRLPGKGHYWPTKVQYLADKRHLERYGRTIYGETHVAMPFGPVPQAAFNASRALAQGELISEFPMDVVRAALRREGDHLVALRDANMELLGVEERESLGWAIRYARDMNFEQLKTASHDAAWTKTAANAPIAWEDIIQTLPQAAQQRFFG